MCENRSQTLGPLTLTDYNSQMEWTVKKTTDKNRNFFSRHTIYETCCFTFPFFSVENKHHISLFHSIGCGFQVFTFDSFSFSVSNDLHLKPCEDKQFSLSILYTQYKNSKDKKKIGLEYRKYQQHTIQFHLQTTKESQWKNCNNPNNNRKTEPQSVHARNNNMPQFMSAIVCVWAVEIEWKKQNVIIKSHFTFSLRS